MDAAAVRELVRRGFRVGFHTRRHDRLTALDDEALDAAMRDGRRELDELAGAATDAIAYPHGRADRRVADAARRAGFRLGFTGVTCAASPEADPLLIGRVHAAAPSPGAFALALVRGLVTTCPEAAR